MFAYDFFLVSRDILQWWMFLRCIISFFVLFELLARNIYEILLLNVFMKGICKIVIYTISARSFQEN